MNSSLIRSYRAIMSGVLLVLRDALKLLTHPPTLVEERDVV